MQVKQGELKKMWLTIKSVVREPRSTSVIKVAKEVNGERITFETKEEVEKALQEEIGERFTLANSAPIMKTFLGERLNYLQDEKLAKSIITGEFEPPEQLDSVTKLLLREIGKVGRILVNINAEKIEFEKDEIKLFWNRVKEFTSSSFSGIHFGHYKAGVKSEIILEVLTNQLNLTCKTGIPLGRWGT